MTLSRPGRLEGYPRRASTSAAAAWVLACACLFLALCAPPASAQTAASRLEVSDLEFEGNTVFPDDSLRFAIVNRETGCRPLLEPLCWMGFEFADKKEYLVRRELDRDVARLQVYYRQRGYRAARVDTAIAYDVSIAATRVTFQIEEGPPVLIDSLAFLGTEVLGEDVLLRNLGLGEGDPLSIVKLEQVRDSLLTRLKNEGYVHADVFLQRFIPEDRPLAAQVTFDIDPGPRAQIGSMSVQVSGEAELSEEVVRSLLPFREGSLYSEGDIQQGQRNLYNLEIVRSAFIALDTAAMRSAPDTLVPLIVQVGTSTLNRVRLGGGWNMADCLSLESRWANRNVFGGAERLQVTGRLSNLLADQFHESACRYAGVDEFGGINWAVSTELNLPAVFSPRNSFSMSLFWERQSLPDVFIREAVGLNFVMTRSFRARMPLSVSYRPQRTSLEAAEVFFCTSLLVCSPEDVAVLADPNWLAPAGIAVTRDRTDQLLNPSTGYSAHLEVEDASRYTGSDFSYTRVAGDMARYWDLAWRTVFAARVRAGWVGRARFGEVEGSGIQIVNPQKRFFAGGANSVRGFSQNSLGPGVLTLEPVQLLGAAHISGNDTILTGPCTPEQISLFTCDADSLEDDEFTRRPTGGTRLLEGSFEYRFAISSDFQGVGFMDFGQVWSERGDFDVTDLEWTPGIGARYFSPIGPLRVDLAYRFRGSEVLPVVTSRIRPFGPGDDPRDRIELVQLDAEGNPVPGEGGLPAVVVIPWVRQDELALLAPLVRFGDERSFWSRLQIHFSIGQAF